jgi:hypothetical protein
MLADPKLIPTGGTSTITVTVRGANNAPLANVSVSLSSSGSDNTITPASATTDANGVATFTFSSTNAEDKTITATANGVTLSDTEVITVFRRSSSIQITSDQNDPSIQGETITVTFAVTVDGGGTPTGTVDIFSLEEAGVGCTVAVSAGSCTFALGTAGLHHLQASYSGDDQFEGSLDPDGEEHTVNPVAADQAPTAVADPTLDRISLYTTPGGGQALTVPSSDGVLANDADPEGKPLTASTASATTANGGTVALASDGGFTYTPAAGFVGADTFTYEASDGSLASSATVTIIVLP